MHIFLYEWITGGGLVEDHGRLPASLLAEGSAMIRALAEDFAAIPNSKVSVLRDARLSDLPLRGCEVIDIHSTFDLRHDFDRLAAAADWSLVVAPEFDRILQSNVAQLRDAGAKSLNAADDFIAIASHKHQTAERLRAAGVAAPAGIILDADVEKLPEDFPYPGVLKPVNGAGSQHTLLVAGSRDEPPPYPWPRRLERFCPGRAASVSVLCGSAGLHPLPPCWQEQSSDGRFTYRGGSVIRDGALSERATAVALQVLRALPQTHGYVGVDLVLGEAPDGSEDFAIEVNPRVTTSYVGLRATIAENLAVQMLNAVCGDEVQITDTGRTVDFFANGSVWRR
jgi:predicted ATP-grasp superfamily ATP-dependent carboligase